MYGFPENPFYHLKNLLLQPRRTRSNCYMNTNANDHVDVLLEMDAEKQKH